MSDQISFQNQEEVVGKMDACSPNENEKHTSLFPKSIIDQLKFDPVEKGPFITVDNSPRSSRNLSVMKAKLREQESRHTLQIVQLKKEYEDKENMLNAELTELKSSVAELKVQLEAELKLRKDAERRDEQSSKDLLVISGKCGELQGRLDESHAALQESRLYIETLQAAQEKKLEEMRKSFAESEEKHQDAKRALEKKIRDMDEQLGEIRTAFQKAMNEKVDQWKAKELEFIASIKQEQERFEKMVLEKDVLEGNLEEIKNQLKEATEGREYALKELNDLREYHQAELNQIREEQVKNQWELDARLESTLAELHKVQQQLVEARASAEEMVADKEKCTKKYEESINVLKNTLTVLDEQNKELAVELKRMQEKYEEKESVSATLATQVNTLLIERNEAQSQKQNLLEEKSKLEEEVARQSQSLKDLASQKDSEISDLQKELASTRNDLQKEIEDKTSVIGELQLAVKTGEETMKESLKAKEDIIEELTLKLQDERTKAAEGVEQMEKMKETVQDYTEQLNAVNGKYESSKQQVAKLNLEMSRLINEVVNIKEENIDLKSGLNEALQKGEFYKDRNFALTEQLAELQREKSTMEAELLKDIQEKKTLIEYLKNQAATATPGASEKKKRRFFQPKSIPISPMKGDGQKATSSSTTTSNTAMNTDISGPPDESS